jgi:GNAT superfamily N-acetyltransferase
VIRVRRCAELTPELCAELDDLDHRCFPHDTRVRTDRDLWWLAYDGKRVVGYASAKVWESDNALYLARAGVLPEARRRGIQRRRIRARVQYARRLGLALLYTYTVPWNTASANNLAACGFRLWRPVKPWGGKHCLYYYRRIK